MVHSIEGMTDRPSPVGIRAAVAVLPLGLSVEDYAAISPAFGDDIASILDFAASVACHDVTGGTALRRD